MEDIKPNSASNGSVVPITSQEGEFSALHSRPTVADLHGENHFAQLARKHWLNPSKPAKLRLNVVKEEIWDELENTEFAFGSLLVLENLQLLERYLWPGYTENASNYHHLLLALMINVKRRENLPSWGNYVL